jgi:zinc/manganese transport system permease protein
MTAESLEILWPALLTGLLVLATHVPLGRIVLERGIVFIDLAVAQVAGLGVVAAATLGWEAHGWAVQASAAAAALLSAALLFWTERRFGPLQEAIIGVLFVAAASAEILLLGLSPRGAEHLKDLLVGQILWVTPGQLLPVAILYAAVLAALATGGVGRRNALFYGLFALTITASVQLVGVFLVFASLIVPILAARAGGAANPLRFAYGVGIAGYLAGLAASAAWDVATGAAVVCALVVTGAAAAAGSSLALAARQS